MSQWVPKIITTDPISCLVDSQILEEEAFLPPPPAGPKPVPASPLKTNSLTDSPSKLTPPILTNLSPTKSIKEISTIQTLSSSVSTNTSPNQPITTISAPFNNKTTSIGSQVLVNNTNGLSTSSTQKNVDIQSEDNGTKLFIELQPRSTILLLNKTSDSAPEVNLDQSSVIKEIKSMEISDNKTINKLWKLPDSGKISNPYFGGKRDLETNNASTSCNDKKLNRKMMEDGPKHNAKENNSHAKNVRSKNDSNIIPFIEIDDTDSVNTPSTTDESDDSLNNDQSKVNGTKKKKRARKQVFKDQTIKSDQEQIGAINKAEDKSEIIPGLGSPKLTTTIEEIDERPSSSKETINNKRSRSVSQSSTDNFVKPMETDNSSTKVNEMNKQSTLSTDTFTNGTSTEIQLSDDDQQLADKPKCIRIGCCNSAVENSDWDFEYCSSKCAVEHCKTAFLNWVATRQLEPVNPTAPSSTAVSTTTN